MERGGWLLALACMLGFSVGCGGSAGESPVADASQRTESTDEADASQRTESTDEADASNEGDDSQGDSQPGPEATVSAFLTAIKSGDQDTANAMLTSLAREKTAEQDMGLAPTESETATFEIGEVELPSEGNGKLAHVACKWTDIGDDGQPVTDEILWALRREKEGWRIGGMATQVFDDQPPVVLDFEDPEDMQLKQTLVEREMERRAHAEAPAGIEGPENGQADLNGPTVGDPPAIEARQHPLRGMPQR